MLHARFAAIHLVEIGAAQPGNGDVLDVGDVEVAVQGGLALVVAIGVQLDRTVLAQAVTGDQAKVMWPILA